MAEPKTTVSSPLGDIISFDGRLPRDEAITEARIALERRIETSKIHLEEINTWDVRTHRGAIPIRSYEEVHGRG